SGGPRPAVQLALGSLDPFGQLGTHCLQLALALDDPLGEPRGDPVQEQDPLRQSGQLSPAHLSLGSRRRQLGLGARETVVERLDLLVSRSKRRLDVGAAVAQQRSLEQRRHSLRLLPDRRSGCRPATVQPWRRSEPDSSWVRSDSASRPPSQICARTSPRKPMTGWSPETRVTRASTRTSSTRAAPRTTRISSRRSSVLSSGWRTAPTDSRW